MAKKAKRKITRKPRGEIPMPEEPKPAYEYDYIELNSSAPKEEIIANLNVAGRNGWQVIEIFSGGGFYRIWVMREVT